MRLSRGDHSYGVVKVMDQFWSVLCGEGFDTKDAKVICRQLGFTSGRALPPGSFGTFYGRYTWPNLNCTGNESLVSECEHDRFRGCQRDNYLGYAAVSCYNGSVSVGTYRLLLCLLNSAKETLSNIFLIYTKEICFHVIHFLWY